MGGPAQRRPDPCGSLNRVVLGIREQQDVQFRNVGNPMAVKFPVELNNELQGKWPASATVGAPVAPPNAQASLSVSHQGTGVGVFEHPRRAIEAPVRLALTRK